MREIEWSLPHRNRPYGSRDLKGGGANRAPLTSITSSRKPTSNRVNRYFPALAAPESFCRPLLPRRRCLRRIPQEIKSQPLYCITQRMLAVINACRTNRPGRERLLFFHRTSRSSGGGRLRAGLSRHERERPGRVAAPPSANSGERGRRRGVGGEVGMGRRPPDLCWFLPEVPGGAVGSGHRRRPAAGYPLAESHVRALDAATMNSR